MSEHKWSNGDTCEVRTFHDQNGKRPDEWVPATYIGWSKAANGHVVEWDYEPFYVESNDLRPPAPPEPVKVERWLRLSNTAKVTLHEYTVPTGGAAHVTLLMHPGDPRRTELDTAQYRREGAEELAARLRQLFSGTLAGDAFFLLVQKALRDIGASPIAEPDAEMRKGGE